MDSQHQTRSATPANGTGTRPGPPTADRSTAVLLSAHRNVLRQALADAINYRDPPLNCSDCETLTSLCGQCAAGLSQARAYLAAARALGMELPQ